MAHVIIENDKVVGIFARPHPHLPGYQEVPDDDPRYLAALDQMEQEGEEA